MVILVLLAPLVTSAFKPVIAVIMPHAGATMVSASAILAGWDLAVSKVCIFGDCFCKFKLVFFMLRIFRGGS